MFLQYINYLIQKATYEKDESGYIVADIPGYQGFFSQWESIEEARENLIDAIQWVLFLKLKQWDQTIIKDLENFSSHQKQPEYA